MESKPGQILPLQRVWTRLQQLLAMLCLVRIPEAVIVCFGTVIGARLSGLDVVAMTVAGVALSNGLLFAASVSINDWHDTEEDRINRPGRPIPSGQLSRQGALSIGVTLLLLGVLAAWYTKPVLGVSACLVGFAAVLYSLKLKSIPLAGNLLVSVVSTYPMWCWTLIGTVTGPVFWTLTLGCLLFRLGAEIVKTSEDVAGDAASGVRTLATIRGVGFSNRLGSALLVIALSVCWLTIGKAGVIFGICLFLSSLLGLQLLVKVFFFAGSTSATGHSLVLAERLMMMILVAGFGFELGIGPAFGIQ